MAVASSTEPLCLSDPRGEEEEEEEEEEGEARAAPMVLRLHRGRARTVALAMLLAGLIFILSGGLAPWLDHGLGPPHGDPSAAAGAAGARAGYPRGQALISAEELQAALLGGGAGGGRTVVLAVVRPADFETSRIPGSQQVAVLCSLPLPRPPTAHWPDDFAVGASGR